MKKYKIVIPFLLLSMSLVGCTKIDSISVHRNLADIESDKFIYRVAVNNIQSYLGQCFQPKKISFLIENAGLIFQKSDAGAQLMLVYDYINRYREEIRVYCQNALRTDEAYDSPVQ